MAPDRDQLHPCRGAAPGAGDLPSAAAAGVGLVSHARGWRSSRASTGRSRRTRSRWAWGPPASSSWRPTWCSSSPSLRVIWECFRPRLQRWRGCIRTQCRAGCRDVLDRPPADRGAARRRCRLRVSVAGRVVRGGAADVRSRSGVGRRVRRVALLVATAACRRPRLRRGGGGGTPEQGPAPETLPTSGTVRYKGDGRISTRSPRLVPPPACSTTSSVRVRRRRVVASAGVGFKPCRDDHVRRRPGDAHEHVRRGPDRRADPDLAARLEEPGVPRLSDRRRRGRPPARRQVDRAGAVGDRNARVPGAAAPDGQPPRVPVRRRGGHRQGAARRPRPLRLTPGRLGLGGLCGGLAGDGRLVWTPAPLRMRLGQSGGRGRGRVGRRRRGSATATPGPPPHGGPRRARRSGQATA